MSIVRFNLRVISRQTENSSAALYARASTEHQKYSVLNQVSALEAYADANQLKIARTFIDDGRSGLRIRGREALQEMLEIVTSGHANFSTILVYDVSRWGRFQDVDESAHYEFLCRRAGVTVKYCAEQFANDGGLPATLLKGLKRAMAAEFSRELSVKVSEGLMRIVSLGYFHGGNAPYATRRVLLDESGRARMVMKRGDAKLLHTDRVVLIHGPEDELSTVRRVFQSFVIDRKPRTYIAGELNREGVPNSWGNRWSHMNIHNLLRNEIYVGRLTYNKSSYKLQTKRERNPRRNWIIRSDLFAPIVDPTIFAETQRLLRHPWTYTDNDLLDFLTATLCAQGRISSDLLRSIPGPSISTYRNRFGTLLNTLNLIGYRGCRYAKYTGDPSYPPHKPDSHRESPKLWKHVEYRYRTPDLGG